jgi:hypothetical protein
MSRVVLFLLGSTRIERHGAPVRVNRRTSVSFLACLAMAGNRHSPGLLAALLGLLPTGPPIFPSAGTTLPQCQPGRSGAKYVPT